MKFVFKCVFIYLYHDIAQIDISIYQYKNCFTIICWICYSLLVMLLLITPIIEIFYVYMCLFALNYIKKNYYLKFCCKLIQIWLHLDEIVYHIHLDMYVKNSVITFVYIKWSVTGSLVVIVVLHWWHTISVCFYFKLYVYIYSLIWQL